MPFSTAVTLPILPRSKRQRTALILFGVAVVMTALTGQDYWGRPPELLRYFGVVSLYTGGLWLTSGYSARWLDRYVTWQQAPGRRLALTLLVSWGGALVLTILVHLSLALAHGSPLRGVLAVRYLPNYAVALVATALLSLFSHSRSFLFGWRAALVRNERLEKEMALAEMEKAQAEAAALRQQLDPHFLFNTLSALTALVKEEPELAVDFIGQLAQVYRYVLHVGQCELVPLAEELAFVEAYVFLQRIRHGEALHIVLPPAGDVPARFAVPPLCLQQLLENALKHNAASVRQPLQVHVSLDARASCLTVLNTRRPRRPGPGESLGIGLPNLRARYAHLTAEPVVVAQTPTAFSVRLPLLELA
ncbi:MAG: sensor histidine kinase [Janthinobacterium lividum]